MRRFTLERTEDISGISGTGTVAEGVQFGDGTAVLRWTVALVSTAVYDSMEDLVAVHGHGGATTVRWVDAGEVATDTEDYVEQQATGWIDIGRFYHEYDRNPPDQRPETADGPGATLALTDKLRGWLPELIHRHQITTMLDAACGDWSWLRLVDLGGVEYTGWDVDPGRIETCRQRVFDEARRRHGCGPAPKFEAVNLLTVDHIDYYDLVLCRDFLMHVTNDHITAVLDKIIAGGTPLLLATTFLGADNAARAWRPEEATWPGYMEQPVDLTAEPFNLPQPIDVFTEERGPWGVLAVPRELALFKIQ
jgi:hypothetical protein